MNEITKRPNCNCGLIRAEYMPGRWAGKIREHRSFGDNQHFNLNSDTQFICGDNNCDDNDDDNDDNDDDNGDRKSLIVQCYDGD
ncbi:hypothetical protein WUBG_04571 [Wuchereria bancrofti]|uniref:Uncharacterized protein n=1 Tax=Wuchereria bancrofti TaxID=6293 RepID=J9EQN7_WUCBA|nr:hypothetical protein WUBG_04571 [Wuchereria bancrofti]VDM07797.1 unnamed protein product [Wuchereria bancrofti]